MVTYSGGRNELRNNHLGVKLECRGNRSPAPALSRVWLSGYVHREQRAWAQATLVTGTYYLGTNERQTAVQSEKLTALTECSCL